MDTFSPLRQIKEYTCWTVILGEPILLGLELHKCLSASGYLEATGGGYVPTPMWKGGGGWGWLQLALPVQAVNQRHTPSYLEERTTCILNMYPSSFLSLHPDQFSIKTIYIVLNSAGNLEVTERVWQDVHRLYANAMSLYREATTFVDFCICREFWN